MVLERRRFARHPFFATAEITESRTSYFARARTNELSREGCYLDMLNPLASGSVLRVRIVHGGETIEIPGRVAHAEPNVGMGVSFDPGNALQELGRWLAEL